MYQGIIIKESLRDEEILDCVTVHSAELWKTESTPRYWTALFFESEDEHFLQKLSHYLTGNWYVDMKCENTKILVFKDKVMSYKIGNNAAKDKIVDYCLSIGIPQEQCDWPE